MATGDIIPAGGAITQEWMDSMQAKAKEPFNPDSLLPETLKVPEDYVPEGRDHEPLIICDDLTPTSKPALRKDMEQTTPLGITTTAMLLEDRLRACPDEDCAFCRGSDGS